MGRRAKTGVDLSLVATGRLYADDCNVRRTGALLPCTKWADQVMVIHLDLSNIFKKSMVFFF